MPHEALRRTIRLLVSLAATAFVYGVPLVRLVRPGGSWFASIRRAAVIVAGVAVVALGLILLFEFQAFDPVNGLSLGVSEIVVVAVALAALAAGLISLAVLPGRDPFLSSERERFFYVYASEVVAGLLFAHIYLTNPQFFPPPAAAVLAARRDGDRVRGDGNFGAVRSAQGERAGEAARTHGRVPAGVARVRLLARQLRVAVFDDAVCGRRVVLDPGAAARLVRLLGRGGDCRQRDRVGASLPSTACRSWSIRRCSSFRPA